MTIKQRKIVSGTLLVLAILFLVRWGMFPADEEFTDHIGTLAFSIMLVGLAWYTWAGREKTGGRDVK